MTDPEDRFPMGDNHFPCDGDGCDYCAAFSQEAVYARLMWPSTVYAFGDRG